MRKYLPLLFAVLLVACGDNNEEQAGDDKDLLPADLVSIPHSASGLDTNAISQFPTMDFADTVHNFGEIAEGEKALFDFEFTNNGKTPLIVSNASGSCGCTVADFPKDPIAPGGSGKISVVFNSGGRPGHQEKSVSVTTNTNRSVHMLYFKGDVKEDPNGTY